MALKMMFAPQKNLCSGYELEVSLELRVPYPSDKFDKMIEKGLSEQYTKMYGKKSVKLIGFDYVQYNKNGWSYYPVQLIVKSKPQGVTWIKWRCENMKEYFDFNVLSGNNLERLPVEYSFCSDEENRKLSMEFPQPNFNYDISSSKNIKFSPNCVQLDISSYTFNYEYQRQMTKKYSEITGISDIQKYLIFGLFIVKHALDKEGYTYGMSRIYSKPHWELDSKFNVIIRWKSNTEKEYISPKDNISSDDVTFEFSPVIPPEYSFADFHSLYIASKDEIINFIKANPHRKQQNPDFGTYFDIKVKSINYPDMSFNLQFKNKLSDSEIQQFTHKIAEYIEQYNSKSENKIHDYNVSVKDENQIKLLIDFGNTEDDALNGLFELLNKIENIKQVVIS